MRGVILGVAIAMLATGASAQVTRCGEEFGKWVCRTEQPPAAPQPRPDVIGARMRALADSQSTMDSFNQSYARAVAMRREREAQRAAQVQAQADANLAAERRRLEAIEIVKGYIAAKQCADAQRVAAEYFGEKGRADAAELCPS